MKKNNTELTFSKDVFINGAESEPMILSPNELINCDMDNRSFFETAYYSLKYRLPLQNEYDLWKDSINNSSSYDFQKKLLEHLGVFDNVLKPDEIRLNSATGESDPESAL